LTNILSTPPQRYPYLPLLKRALEIASQARIGVYDCLYVALAEREGCEFSTADDRLVRTLRPTFPFITLLGSLP
jgi:predicted nucleic acid-binding protein